MLVSEVGGAVGKKVGTELVKLVNHYNRHNIRRK